MSGFLYPMFGHWAWGPDGWLNNIHPAAFHDFAGSTVVHTIGGSIALAGAIVLGPGRPEVQEGRRRPSPPQHDDRLRGRGHPWFGWYGFNPGSTLSAMDSIGIGARRHKTDARSLHRRPRGALLRVPAQQEMGLRRDLNGLLAGLVAITAPCYWVSPLAP